MKFEEKEAIAELLANIFGFGKKETKEIPHFIKPTAILAAM
jgi:hypothetical protein